ncbi:T9SS-dependent choice-of-anchor J family protein [Mesoflavibacter sp. CH_XMU1404-2]|uniref:T9SS-dependent choice-of-anchor J family protein n=1 Tax=Mesoflavibacter sp. CH_XMU1404-2 TaxID=3107766 RepID=UPI0030087756
MKKNTFLLFMFFVLAFAGQGFAQSTIHITTSGGNFPTEKWVNITTEIDGGGTQVWGQGDGSYGNGEGLIDLDVDIAPGTYYVNCYDRYSDGWDGTTIEVSAYGVVIGDNGGVSPSDSSTVDSSPSWEAPADELEASFEIIVPEPPSCPDPNTLLVNNITTNSADLSWTAGGTETSWNIELVDITAGGTVTGTATATGVTNPYSLTGLTASNDYEYYVQADCTGGDFSTWVGPFAFTTACEAVGSFTEGFESFSTNVDANCWSENIGGSGGYVYVSSSDTNTGTRALRTGNSGTSSAEHYIISPQLIDMSAGTHRLSFFMEASATITSIEVGSMTDPNSSATFTTIQSLAWSTTMEQKTIYFDSPNTDDYFAIKVTFGTSTYNYASFDDVVWEPIPSCIEPSALTASNVTSSSADLSWTAGGTETSWNIELVDVTAGGTVTGTATATGVVNPYTLSGLTANNDYEYYVQADCGGDTSAWEGPFALTTLCNPITSYPWTEDFESVSTPDLPNCWSYINNNGDTDYWRTYTTYGVGGSTTAGLYTDFNSGNNDDYLVLPQFTLTGNERLKFSVRARSSSEPNDYRVVLSTLGSTPTDFTEELLPLTQVSSTTQTEITPIDLSGYTGDVFIAIHVPSGGLDGYYIYFDEFVVEPIPSCIEPSALTASNVTSSSADLSWTAGGTETSWNIELVDVTAGGTVTGTATATGVTNPHSLTGLAEDNDYEYYVQADCGGDTSAWAGPYTFSTYKGCGSSGSFTYTNNSNLSASLNSFASSVPGDTITLTFTAGSTEIGYDDWFIVDSADGTGNIIDSGSGSIVGSYESTTGEISFYVVSDGIVTGSTFEFSVSCSSLSTNDFDQEIAFTYYPNPVNNNLNLSAQKEINNVSVYNMVGQEVYRSTPNAMTDIVDMSGLQAGAYFVKVTVGNATKTVKVIKK